MNKHEIGKLLWPRGDYMTDLELVDGVIRLSQYSDDPDLHDTNPTLIMSVIRAREVAEAMLALIEREEQRR